MVTGMNNFYPCNYTGQRDACHIARTFKIVNYKTSFSKMKFTILLLISIVITSMDATNQEDVEKEGIEHNSEKRFVSNLISKRLLISKCQVCQIFSAVKTWVQIQTKKLQQKILIAEVVFVQNFVAENWERFWGNSPIQLWNSKWCIECKTHQNYHIICAWRVMKSTHQTVTHA